jgi:hypothetical protein
MSLSHHRYSQITGIPCATVLTVSFVLFPGTGLSCPRRSWIAHDLNASIGAPEPHDFAVRVMVVRLSTWPRPSHPASRFVTIAHTPLLPRQDGRIDKPVSTEPRSEKFSLMGWTDVERLDAQKH